MTTPPQTNTEHLHQEIERLVKDIEHAKQEIFSIATDGKSDNALGDASLHLDEVIKATEAATNSIMDAADAIQEAASGIGGDKEAAIVDATTRIYEACNFQDISGQRLNKVIKLLAHIEERVIALNGLFGKPAPVVAAKAAEPDLLAGPALKTTSQDDIDALFAGGN